MDTGRELLRFLPAGLADGESLSGGVEWSCSARTGDEGTGVAGKTSLAAGCCGVEWKALSGLWCG